MITEIFRSDAWFEFPKRILGLLQILEIRNAMFGYYMCSGEFPLLTSWKNPGITHTKW